MMLFQRSLTCISSINEWRCPSSEEVLAVADVLSVHVPLSEKTKHLIGAKQIALMRDDCILMNYARDGIYDDAAVLEALNTG